MITSFFTARIGKDAQVRESKNGKFMSMDVVVNDKINGEEKSTWVRVTSNKPNHINLAQYLTKGKVINIVGNTSSRAWIDKEGKAQSQLKVSADKIDFLNFGKRKVETQQPSGDVAVETKEETPFNQPDTNEEAPF
jgi:single-strand DNA-binding protein